MAARGKQREPEAPIRFRPPLPAFLSCSRDRRRKREAVGTGQVEATLKEGDVDVDPDYQNWQSETLQAAVLKLKESRPATRFPAHGLLGLAASVLFIVSFWSVNAVRDLNEEVLIASHTAADLEGKVRDQERELRQLHDGYHELEQTASADAVVQGEVIAYFQGKLRAAQSEFAQPNLPFKEMSYDTQRSNVVRRGQLRLLEQTLEMSRHATHVALVLEIVNAEPYERYRLEIRDDSTKELVWENDELERSIGGGVVELAVVGARVSALSSCPVWD